MAKKIQSMLRRGNQKDRTIQIKTTTRLLKSHVYIYTCMHIHTHKTSLHINPTGKNLSLTVKSIGEKQLKPSTLLVRVESGTINFEISLALSSNVDYVNTLSLSNSNSR